MDGADINISENNFQHGVFGRFWLSYSDTSKVWFPENVKKVKTKNNPRQSTCNSIEVSIVITPDIHVTSDLLENQNNACGILYLKM